MFFQIQTAQVQQIHSDDAATLEFPQLSEVCKPWLVWFGLFWLPKAARPHFEVVVEMFANSRTL